jgi:hypothetical protein
VNDPSIPQTNATSQNGAVTELPIATSRSEGSERATARLRVINWPDVFLDAPSIFRHTVTLMLALISIWILHLLLVYLLGKEAKFFDWIPVRYVFDAADLAMVLKFLWHLIRGFNK